MRVLLPTVDVKQPKFQLQFYRYEGLSDAELPFLFDKLTILFCLGESVTIDMGEVNRFTLEANQLAMIQAPEAPCRIFFEQKISYELFVISPTLPLIRSAVRHSQKPWKEIIEQRRFLLTGPNPITKEMIALLRQSLVTSVGGMLLFTVVQVMRQVLKLCANEQRSGTKNARQVYQYMVEHAYDLHPIKEVVADAGILSNPARRKFRELTGTSPMLFVLKLRIEKVKDMLRDTDLPIKEIAKQIGFSCYDSFGNSFQKQVGASASSYRKSIREKLF
jgi:AraC-like DNA-binding protein